jgi:hypothetical protein
MEIADVQGDVDAFIAKHDAHTRRVPRFPGLSGGKDRFAASPSLAPLK